MKSIAQIGVLDEPSYNYRLVDRASEGSTINTSSAEAKHIVMESVDDPNSILDLDGALLRVRISRQVDHEPRRKILSTYHNNEYFLNIISSQGHLGGVLFNEYTDTGVPGHKTFGGHLGWPRTCHMTSTCIFDCRAGSAYDFPLWARSSHGSYFHANPDRAWCLDIQTCIARFQRLQLTMACHQSTSESIFPPSKRKRERVEPLRRSARLECLKRGSTLERLRQEVKKP